MAGPILRRVHFLAPGVVLLAVAVRAPATASAQVANGSTAAFAMGENYTALAHGFDAVAWNPAGLGLRGTGRSSFAVLVVRGGTGIGPVTLGDLADWSNRLVPAGVKSEWLARLGQESGESGSADADVTWLGVQIGRLAVHASSSLRAEAALAPGVAELILFGNVGESGEARALALGGSSGVATAHSAVGASFAQPILLGGGGRIALGATVKYVVGHGMAVGDNSTGATTVDPLSVALDFPAVHTAGSSPDRGRGSGFGLDLGFGWDTPGGLSLGLAVRNVVSTFEWDADGLRFTPLAVRLDEDTAMTETGELPFASAPGALQRRVADLKFHPALAGGIAWRASPAWMVAGDVRITSDDGIRTGPARHIGGGLEFRPAPWLPLRAGVAAISSGAGAGGWQAGVGFGFDLGAWNLAAGALLRDAGRLGAVTSFMVTLFGSGR